MNTTVAYRNTYGTHESNGLTNGIAYHEANAANHHHDYESVSWDHPAFIYTPAAATDIVARFRAMGWVPPSEPRRETLAVRAFAVRPAAAESKNVDSTPFQTLDPRL